jgi:hypothetical protein
VTSQWPSTQTGHSQAFVVLAAAAIAHCPDIISLSATTESRETRHAVPADDVEVEPGREDAFAERLEQCESVSPPCRADKQTIESKVFSVAFFTRKSANPNCCK